MTTGSDDASFAGKRILVTGASSGIGMETALRLAAQGAAIGVHYHRHRDAATSVVEQIRRSGGSAVALCADFLDRDRTRALVPEAVEALGGLDGLVNNAGGIPRPRNILEVDDADWDQTFELNVHAPFVLAQGAFAHMLGHGGGRIVNISSIGVKFGGSPTSLHYSAAKAALESLTVGLSKAGAPHGILVNTIRPGVTATPSWASTPDDALDQRIALIPLKRAGTPEEIASMIVYLLSPSATFITGQMFAVSGGE